MYTVLWYSISIRNEGNLLTEYTANISSGVQSQGVTSFIALMRELQETLYIVARTAELGREDSLSIIQKQAELSLRLIDSYLLSSQAQSGQITLQLSPYGVGSIMHQSAYDLRSAVGCDVAVQVGVNQPIMTHKELLKNLLSCAGNFIAEAVQSEVTFRSFITKKGDIGVGVFAKHFNLKPADLRQAIDSSAVMPMARQSSKSGVMILMADGIARALGSSLSVKRMGPLNGIVTMLPRSEQLSMSIS